MVLVLLVVDRVDVFGLELALLLDEEPETSYTSVAALRRGLREDRVLLLLLDPEPKLSNFDEPPRGEFLVTPVLPFLVP